MKNLSVNKGNKLSPRAIEILSFLILGYTNEEIGKKLFISPHTVKAYMEHLLDIFDVNNRTALAAIAAKYLPSKSLQNEKYKKLLTFEK